MRTYATTFILLFLTTLTIHIPGARAVTPHRTAYSPFAPFHYLDRTPERAIHTTIHISPFYIKKLRMFTSTALPRLKQIITIRPLADISKKELSVITYRGNGWHKKHVESLEVTTVESSSITSIWQMLQRKRGDLVIEWPEAVTLDIQRPWLTGQILDTRIIPAEKPFHLMIRNSSGHVNILNDFNLTTEAMRRDGTLKSILARYR